MSDLMYGIIFVLVFSALLSGGVALGYQLGAGEYEDRCLELRNTAVMLSKPIHPSAAYICNIDVITPQDIIDQRRARMRQTD